MLLHKLKEYADAGRVERMAPTGYKETPVRYVIHLDEGGRFIDCVDQAQGATGRQKRGKPTFTPHVGRTQAIRAKLLADNAEYALGIARGPGKQVRVDQAHRAFVVLVRACAEQTGEPVVAAVRSFLEGGADTEGRLPADFDPSDIVTFQVGDVLPIELPTVREFWASRSGAGEAGSGTDGEGDGDGEQAAGGVAQCLVCGQMRPPMKRLLYKWQGIPGGQQAGLALISANEPAFMSYGLAASLIAPTCATCGERFSKAANALLADPASSLRIGPLAYIFWTREPVADFSFSGFFTDPNPEQVRALYRAPFGGRREAAEIEATPFYAAAFSASGARVVVRDWLDTTVGRAIDNLRRYFWLQEIVGLDGVEAPPLKLVALAGATARELKDLTPEVTKDLLRVALGGGRLPQDLLFAAVRRCRAEGRVTRAQAALIKMVLLSERPVDQERRNDVSEAELIRLDGENRHPAYLCGRLLAVLEATQRAALGDINATIVDRYFGTASSAPASVFGRLLRGAQPHLSKLRREHPGTYNALQQRLEEVQEHLDHFPRTLTLVDQGLFALGYYHQRAANRAAATAARANRDRISERERQLAEALATETEPVADTDGDERPLA